MNPMYADLRLLAAWRGCRDAASMDELIRRHAGFVFGTARRILRGDDALAQDVTQAVFLVLIQKPPRRVTCAAGVAVWLPRTTRSACANAIRLRARRLHHEANAARLNQLQMIDSPESITATND